MPLTEVVSYSCAVWYSRTKSCKLFWQLSGTCWLGDWTVTEIRDGWWQKGQLLDELARDSGLELCWVVTARWEVAIGTKNAFFQRFYLEGLPILLNNDFRLILDCMQFRVLVSPRCVLPWHTRVCTCVQAHEHLLIPNWEFVWEERKQEGDFSCFK